MTTATLVATPEYAAIRYLLTSPQIAARTQKYIREDDFDWAGLLTEADTMSSGERLLVRLAYDLWEGTGLVGLRELPRRLGAGNFDRVIDALYTVHGSPRNQDAA
jgi:hypothetical protein